MTEERQYSGYLEEELSLLRSKLAKQKADYEERLLDLVDELHSTKEELKEANKQAEELSGYVEEIGRENDKLKSADRFEQGYARGRVDALNTAYVRIIALAADLKTTNNCPNYYIERGKVLHELESLKEPTF